eukprot:889456_1
MCDFNSDITKIFACSNHKTGTILLLHVIIPNILNYWFHQCILHHSKLPKFSRNPYLPPNLQKGSGHATGWLIIYKKEDVMKGIEIEYYRYAMCAFEHINSSYHVSKDELIPKYKSDGFKAFVNIRYHLMRHWN